MKRPRTPGRGITGAHRSLGGDHFVSQPSLWKQARSAGRTVTIARLIDRLTAERGTPPTDRELAALLAISITAVRRHRDLLARSQR